MPQGIWIWLVFLVPMLCAILILWLWLRLRTEEEPVLPVKQIGQTIDDFGMYNTVRPIPAWEKGSKKRPTVFIDVGSMPQQRPLGIELQELKVIRVLASGAQWGWQVGDKIVSIAGQVVVTFEELWDRIQSERDRVPVRFIVERGEELIDPIAEEIARLNEAARQTQQTMRRNNAATAPSPEQLEAGLAKGAQQGATGKVAPAPSPAFLEVAKLRQPAEAWVPKSSGALSPKGLPSALVGWETWEARLEDEPQIQEKHSRSAIVKNTGVERGDLGTTKFMRSYALTDGEKLKKTLSRPTDVGMQDVRFKRDGWGRSVIQVGNQGRHILSCDGDR